MLKKLFVCAFHFFLKFDVGRGWHETCGTEILDDSSSLKEDNEF